MSDDLVNQLTLNFLISKNQLQKLNKKIMEDKDNVKGTNKKIYNERIRELFTKMLDNEEPEDLIQEVRTSFDYFLEKCIYYFKTIDNNEYLEKERKQTQNSDELGGEELGGDELGGDDLDYDDLGGDDLGGDDLDYDELDYDELDDDDLDEKNNYKMNCKKIELEECLEECSEEEEEPIIVRKKIKKNAYVSEGVDDIQKLPLNWFQNVRQEYKKNKIIPRKQEISIETDNTFNDFNSKKKNLYNLYGK